MKEATKTITVDGSEQLLKVNFETLCAAEDATDCSILEALGSMTMRRLGALFHAALVTDEPVDVQESSRMIDELGVVEAAGIVTRLYQAYFDLATKPKRQPRKKAA